jgi:hypothetical protein
MKSKSKKQEAREREYSKLRKEYLEDKQFCRAKIPGKCTIKGTDIHHTRGRVGANLLDTSTWMLVCRSCHRAIEDMPHEVAVELGFKKNRI